MEVAMENGTRCAWAGGTIIYPQRVPPEDSLTRPATTFKRFHYGKHFISWGEQNVTLLMRWE